VCVGAVSKQDYQKNINNVMLLLKGEKNKLLKKLTKENPAAALALKHFQDVTLIIREDFVVGEQKFNRIEGYDISHFAGKEVYGSMVVFANGVPDKAQYRLFKIRTVGNNDLDALKEMMERRLKHIEWPKPDLILIDGGKPQVDYISKIFIQQQITVPLLGISKLNGDRLVYPSGTKNVFKDLAETIKRTLQGVRDEAHRFANRGRSRRYSNDNFGG
jgi:excinuclease UvrABC nuclease subunit